MLYDNETDDIQSDKHSIIGRAIRKWGGCLPADDQRSRRDAYGVVPTQGGQLINYSYMAKVVVVVHVDGMPDMSKGVRTGSGGNGELLFR
jgi:hypothetical protein